MAAVDQQAENNSDYQASDDIADEFH